MVSGYGSLRQCKNVKLMINNTQIWTGYEGNSKKYVPEGVWVDNYFTRP